ncbi:hypothetical protein [Metabacillus sp. Hm71]|uniref:hypothetical protein n=1 Tax=Metabacillus sp. Hm71 TaxID=3450743 RepID=UPI003F43CEFD
MKLIFGMVYCCQLLLWSGYSLVGWLSKKDSVIAKAFLLLVFFYLAYLIAYTCLKTKKAAFLISLASLIIFMLGKQVYLLLFV